MPKNAKYGKKIDIASLARIKQYSLDGLVEKKNNFFFMVLCISLTMTKIAIMLNQKCAQAKDRVRNK